MASSSSASTLSLSSTASVLRSLTINVQHFTSSMKDRVTMGNIKFESLCHGLASSLQEISLRLVKMSEEEGSNDKSEKEQHRAEVLECRKRLLECASGLVLNAKHPFKAFSFMNDLVKACEKALFVAERHERRAVVLYSAPALESLDHLEKTVNYNKLFANIKLFSSKLHSFLEATSRISQDICDPQTRNEIIIWADIVRKLLPILIQSLRESLKHPNNSQTRSTRSYFFKLVRVAIEEIVKVVKEAGSQGSSSSSKSKVGLFITKLDSVLDYCEKDQSDDHSENHKDWYESVEWLLKFALSVAKVCHHKDEAEIVSTCENVLREANNLKRTLDQKQSESEVGIAKDILRDVIEALEQLVNNSLLKLIIEMFCTSTSALDELIHYVLKSTVSPPDRLPEDVDDLVASIDDRIDLLFHLAHFTTFCTSDKSKCLSIETSLRLMQRLEMELVPACMKLYFNPDDHGARFHLRTVRSLWVQEASLLEENILGIVDATAFCYVVNQEAREVAAELKRDQYSQDKSWICDHGLRLIRMCQRAVDFAWKDLANRDDVLPDDHPIVKVERSTWEVQGALRLVLNNIEDLNLHKTMIRRVQVLVSCLGNMSAFLMKKNETTVHSVSKVRVLTSVTRITIGPDSKMTVVQGDRISVSRNKTMSFRSVQRKNSILKSSKDNLSSKSIDESMRKLTMEAREEIPFHSRKASKRIEGNNPGTASVSKLGADFTEIFDELSALSKNVSECLAIEDDDERTEKEATDASAAAQRQVKDMSLRQIAFLNSAKHHGVGNKLTDHSISGYAYGGNLATTSDRLNDIKTLDAKLAAIRSDLEGTES